MTTEHIRADAQHLRSRLESDLDCADDPELALKRLCDFDRINYRLLPLRTIRVINFLESEAMRVLNAFDDDDDYTMKKYQLHTDSDIDAAIERLDNAMIAELLLTVH